MSVSSDKHTASNVKCLNGQSEFLLAPGLSEDQESSTAPPCRERRRCRLFTVQTFVIFAGLVLCAQMALASYSKGILTSIEKYFGVSSSLAGFIVGSFNIGNLLFVIAVSKLSSTGHRPRIMAAGSLLIALGGFINFTPHLVKEPYKLSNSSTVHPHANTTNSSHPHLYVVLICGELLQGVGATVQIPLGSSYIDDFATNNNSPLYLGILFLLQNIGPGFGYLIGSVASTFFVDFDRLSPDDIPVTVEDKDRWVGAWWLGYLIISAWVAVAAFPLFFFPKSMKVDAGDSASNDVAEKTSSAVNLQSNAATSSASVEKAKKTSSRNAVVDFFKDFFRTLVRLLTNLPYMSAVFGFAGLMFVVGSLTSFLPKFIEVTFNKTTSAANLIFGLAIPPTVCFGLIAGGIMVKKSQWELLGILKFIIGLGVGALVPMFFTVFISCSASVSEACQSPVLSPNTTLLPTQDPLSILQDCKEMQCRTASILFIVLTSIAAMMASAMVTPTYTVLLRSVHSGDKCTAIGLMFFIVRVIGLVPAPIISGAVIDQTCTQWNYQGQARTNCLRYNQEQFRIRLLLIYLLGVFGSVASFSVAYLKVRAEKRNNDPEVSKSACPLNLQRWLKMSRDRPEEEN